MTTADILHEHRYLSRILRQDDVDRLRAEGVPNEAIFQPSLVKRDWVTFLPNDRFEFERYCDHDEGVLAFVILAENSLGDIADIIAWRGQRVATWLGSVALAGEEQAYGPRLEEDCGIDIHPTMLDWLRAGRRGMVIVDPLKAPSILSCTGGPLRAASVEYGRELRRICSQSCPTVLVPSSRRLAA